jgi:acyl carrier protein
MYEGEIKSVIARQLQRTSEDITSEMHLGDDLGADSLDVTEILLICEQELGLRLGLPEDRLGTVRDLIQWVTDKAREQEHPAGDGQHV